MRAREESGFTLVELIIVSSLFLIVLSATLGASASFERLNHRNQEVNDQGQQARRGLDRVARQLRNLARRIDVPTISRAERSDFIFQTSDPQKTWVRECLEARSDGSTWMWSLTTPGSVTTAMSGPCPGTGWTKKEVVAQNVTNTLPNRTFPLFTFACMRGAPTGCPATTSDLGKITTVTIDLLIDDDPIAEPAEARVRSAVFLRNQNEPPTSVFYSRPVASRIVLLNASASMDPEGRTLRFMWFRSPAPAFTCEQGPPADTLLWQGVTLTHTFAVTDGVIGAVKSFDLVVCDPGDLQSRYTGTVPIP
jgi:prepilin-type N-terminal cleavage/methylation domain-containing protein